MQGLVAVLISVGDFEVKRKGAVELFLARGQLNYVLSGRKVSIVDVAKITGLSRSTVDRVLNNRPGVRPETRAKVEQALDSLGYAASSLTTWRSKQKTSVNVLVPEGTNPFFARIRVGIEDATRRLPSENLDISFKPFDPYEPNSILKLLNSTHSDVNAIITVGVDTHAAEASIRNLVSRGVRVVTLVSDVPNSMRTAYVGLDNFSAGRTAGRLMIGALGPEQGTVAVVLGHLEFRHLLDRQSGFQQIIGLERPDLDVALTRPYGTDRKKALEIVDGLIANHPRLRGVYLGGGGQPYLIEALSKLSDRNVITIGHEVTGPTRAALRSGAMQFVLAHDVHEVGRKAVDAIFDAKISGPQICEIKIHVSENLPKDD